MDQTSSPLGLSDSFHLQFGPIDQTAPGIGFLQDDSSVQQQVFMTEVTGLLESPHIESTVTAVVQRESPYFCGHTWDRSFA